jgi:hypothetical protein
MLGIIWYDFPVRQCHEFGVMMRECTGILYNRVLGKGYSAIAKDLGVMLLFLVIRQQLGSDLSTSLKACTKHKFYLTSESHSVLRDHERPYTLRHLDIVYTLATVSPPRTHHKKGVHIGGYE